ncbi:hypothetical protein L873DRAFT_1679176, partial [Choiromyces venosus 120613-1]
HPTYVITALAPSETGAAVLRKKYPSIRTVLGDLDAITLLETESENADVVIHTKDCDHVAAAKALVAGMSRRPQGGLLLHTSGVAIIADEPNEGDCLNPRVWDDVADEKESFPDTHWHRPADKVMILESPEKVRTAVICPPTVFGRGRGVKKTGMGAEALHSGFKKAGAFQIGSGAPR